MEPCFNPRSHFQWSKLQIPARGSLASAQFTSNNSDTTADSSSTGQQLSRPSDRADLKQRINEAIKKSYEGTNSKELSLKMFGIGPDFPAQVTALSYLVSLDLSRNIIERITADFSCMPKLEQLNLRYYFLSRYNLLFCFFLKHELC